MMSFRKTESHFNVEKCVGERKNTYRTDKTTLYSQAWVKKTSKYVIFNNIWLSSCKGFYVAQGHDSGPKLKPSSQLHWEKPGASINRKDFYDLIKYMIAYLRIY